MFFLNKMITRFRKITVVRICDREETINRELQWLSQSLGLVSQRDKDQSCYRVFLEILKTKKPLSSDELAYKLNLSRGTVVHHLTKLIGAGIVVVQDNLYSLRGKNLETTLKKIKADILSAYEEIEDVGKKIDKKLNL